MTKSFSQVLIFIILQMSTHAYAQATLPFPDGIWVGEYTCRGNTLPLMIEFDSQDKPSSIAYLIKKKKGKTLPAKFHANVERFTNKKGEEILIFKPRYWLNNPGQVAMLKLRGKHTAETIEGNIKKKGVQKISTPKTAL